MTMTAERHAVKTKYQFIHFEKLDVVAGRSSWSCHNNKTCDELGIVKWYSTWHQYCYFPYGEDTVYSAGCLNDIQDFIGQLTNRSKT